ncbi:MAG: 16S rRNA (cytidine(1402)-2'-O)-methyltransferase [Actinomycetota bacterium]
MAGLLRVVATPIGNLDDLSPRAAQALAEADVIACEDTRVTRKLLSRVETHARLISYHARNERQRTPELVARVSGGDRVALVTDAGTPGLSDPGQRLVAACIEAGQRVEVVPGPSAAVAALVVSGLPTARFVFEGFLPRTKGDRRRRLERLAGEERTLVFFEAPHRIAATLSDMADVFGDRNAAFARELTKMHEEVVRGTLSELAAAADGVRGEITIVVAGATPPAGGASASEIAERLRATIEEGVSKKEAIAAVAAELGVAKKLVYQTALDERL